MPNHCLETQPVTIAQLDQPVSTISVARGLLWSRIMKLILQQAHNRGPTMDCPPIPQFCLNFMPRS